MPIIEWNVSLLLGIPEIDQHHRQMVQLLNTAYDDFRQGNSLPPSLIEEVISCSSQHFAYEEGLMVESSYPKLLEHKEEHHLFSCRVLELQKNYRQTTNISIELLWFLCNWVTHHIRETDAELGRFLDIVKIRKRLSRNSR
jgi:hemerythrin